MSQEQRCQDSKAPSSSTHMHFVVSTVGMNAQCMHKVSKAHQTRFSTNRYKHLYFNIPHIAAGSVCLQADLVMKTMVS